MMMMIENDRKYIIIWDVCNFIVVINDIIYIYNSIYLKFK